MDNRAFVLGLSGLPGAGKSTLTRFLQRRYNRARVVHYDRYQPLTRMSEAQVRDWFARGGDPNEFDHGALVDELRRETAVEPGLTRRPLVLFETPFGRLHRETGAFIDFLVWIDTPLDLALSRAMLAFTEIARGETAPGSARDFINWQRQYLMIYPTVRDIYSAHGEKIAATADLIVDGGQTTEVSAERIDESLVARGFGP